MSHKNKHIWFISMGVDMGVSVKKKNNSKQNREKEYFRNQRKRVPETAEQVSSASKQTFVLGVFTLLFGRRCCKCQWILTCTELATWFACRLVDR